MFAPSRLLTQIVKGCIYADAGPGIKQDTGADFLLATKIIAVFREESGTH